MADVATERARREARRKRILENSEDRLQRITGRYKEKSTEETVKPMNNDVTYSLPKFDNSISSSILTSESQSILKEKHLNFLEQVDKSFEIKDYELDDASTKFQKPEDLFSSDYPIRQSPKSSKEPFDANIFKSTSQQNLDPKPSQSLLSFRLLYSPLCSIFLAAFMNILLLARVNFSTYESIIVPYLILAITRLCFQYKAEKSQESSMLVAALILCNIKPEVVHTFKRIMSLISTFSRGFALYITSFTVINWLISFFWIHQNSLNFN